jgi:hypothetical protein
MISLRTFTIVAAAATLGLAGCAQTPFDHAAHHPVAAPMPMAGPGGVMAHMDEHMKAMREMHDKMMRAKTPEERNALMAEHRKLMQEGMAMMGEMGPGGMGAMGGDMATRQKMMEKRMEMMQSMMPMMMDCMPQAPAKP